MTNNKPVHISPEDWERTPPAVRTFIGNHLHRLAQIQPGEVIQPPDGPAALYSLETEPLVGSILIVDDNELNRDMLARRLQRQGHTTQVAVNGREALGKLAEDNFDLVLLDIMMPEMNGYEALERIKNDPAIGHIPVIMISAIDEIDSIVRCIKLGAEDYLPKPFNGTLLKARIGASLEKKRLRDRQAVALQQLNIENRRKSLELEHARRIQRSMLPATPPSLPYLDIAASQETASEVGGDYYDFRVEPDNRLLLLIGDATGHGVASGLLVSMTKASLLTTAETDLRALITKINEILNAVELEAHLNMALLVFELTPRPEGGVLVRVCGGGMPPVYLFRRHGRVEEVVISGIPLAVTRETSYAVTEFRLEATEKMLVFSDGLLEMFNRRHEFLGFERLTAALEMLDATQFSAKDLLDQVRRVGHEWAQGHPLQDDVTLVALKVK
jgi:sigma-B regulation protein RsbU (phosphoserine phosphatase)